MIRKALVLFILIVVLFALLVPNEKSYFNRVAKDYGVIHQNMDLTAESLKELGDFEYNNRVLYSHFEYQFGNISVSYFGFLTFVVFQKSEFKERQGPHVTV